ncbi:ABC-type branched-subunit amino acid transport system ATPase component [Paraburkholderia sp. WC7.3g]|uniref:ABC transporter ATP-binding protein n=1 Tax=Paraburkholderia TaxID=1822464 RepID=UPI001654DFFF|nr:ABC transporter ATP-binding protein [Paraburkholderia podalyriae]
MAKTSEEVLRVEALEAGYGSVRVIRNAAIAVHAGEVVGLLGRNGAGKTTFINAIAGLLACASGSIVLAGREVSELPAHRRVGAGVTIVPSGGRLFKSLTVEENLAIGVPHPDLQKVTEIFALFPELLRLRSRYAGKLSGGERQMVAIGRALMLDPKLLLMDEPSEGLAPIVVLRLAESIKALQARGVGILVAEQNVKFTDLVCQRWYGIDKGAITDRQPTAMLPRA